MRLPPGSALWLLRHELRLAGRNFSDQVKILAILIGVFWVILHAGAYAMMERLTLSSLDGLGGVFAGIAFWFALTLMLSSAIVLCVNALFDRGDLDLLLSSPVPVRTVFVVRGIGIAVSSVVLFALLVLPFAHMGVLRGQFNMAAAYPALAATALGVAGVGLALTMALVRWFGARRARVLAQVLGAVIGALLFLAFQLPNLQGDEERARLLARLGELLNTASLGPGSPLWWPPRAFFGDPLPLAAIVIAGTGIFFVVTAVTCRIFLAGTQEAPSQRRQPVKLDGRRRFHQGLARNVVLKELKLIARDPNLIARTLLQGLYLLPMLVLLARRADVTTFVAPAVILLLSGIAGNLAWITISGEEAPDLLGSAPVSRSAVRWYKALAALIPVGAIGLAFSLFYLWRAPLMMPVFLFFVALAVTAAAVTQVWGGKPSPNRDLKLRHKQNVGLNFLELLGTLAFAGGCYLTMAGFWQALALVPVGLIAPGVAWTMRERGPG